MEWRETFARESEALSVISSALSTLAHDLLCVRITPRHIACKEGISRQQVAPKDFYERGTAPVESTGAGGRGCNHQV